MVVRDRLSAMKWIVAAMLVGCAGWVQAAEAPTAREIVERIKARVGVPWADKTVDTFKAGDPETRVTGIATTFMASMDVLERAVAEHKNFIITHEPTFYSHLDTTEDLKNDPVYRAKLAYIERHHLVVWRFHDHDHQLVPDPMIHALAGKLGWKMQGEGRGQALFTIPETRLDALAGMMRGKLGQGIVRVIGDPGLRVTKVALVPGAAGRNPHLAMLRRDDVQVLVVGEATEWEGIAYARDAVAQHRAKGLILLGHVVSEEPGMEECVGWLRGFITEVPVGLVATGDRFWEVK